ncbi:MarR family winged helix-turn-helix transcriptional regulator [Enterovibrio sp. ZSDZ35]|uniref:MarR family winged helix-turn-helix transcriptional regulator n=1 Tax=Enterovibrio qingdaonensis TaxID=2899818 RepID=A0ABT5QKN7_9GAMM|nr:MarR family winged helix-turn-helix transcriptional regulator [Enterovibrio sp. ZSDZ35]MDD1781556.1 MarR family winged helix-turn-helix transcriptional regulator [Enterovibrio sp. ZSDZ35]
MSNEDPLCDIIERITTLFRNEVRLAGLEYGLHPVHLEVLYYLSRCNQFSDTPAAVTEFLGITKGTTSQSITLLEKKGFLTKEKDPIDRRVTHLRLSKQGLAVSQQAIPPASIRRGIESLGDAQDTLKTQLEALLRDIQKSNNCASFGLCKTCRFHKPYSDQEFFCDLTKMTLNISGGDLICREHSAPTEDTL